MPNLDVTPAARWLQAEDAGEALVWHEDGQPAAFAVVRSVPRRDASRQTHLTIEVAACLPHAAAHWPRYMSELQTYARSVNKAGLLLPVNARQAALLRSGLEAGLEIVHTRARMAQGAWLGAPDDTILLTLAM
jgi:hypothetical protein